jgi:hypothetical protein
MRMTRRASVGARSERVLWHRLRWLTDGNVLQGEVLHYRAPPVPVWSKAQGMDGPRRHPHGVQLGAGGGGWTVGGKVNTTIIHGPRRTRLTWLRASAHSEEGGDGDAELTDMIDGAGAQRRGRYYSDGSGRSPGARWCSATYNMGRRDGEP